MCFIIQISFSDSAVIHTENFPELIQRIYKLPLERENITFNSYLFLGSALRENEIKIPQILIKIKSQYNRYAVKYFKCIEHQNIINRLK